MKQKIEEILDLLLSEMEKGKSLEDCLKDYPEYGDELRPFLSMAQQIKDLPKPEPTDSAIAETLVKVGKMVAGEKHMEEGVTSRKFLIFQPALVRALAVILIVIIAGWVGFSYSARSMPGEFLYPMKLFTEKIQYILTVNPQGKAELHITFADKRTEELVNVFDKDKKLNKELLSAMLNEAQSALLYTEAVGSKDSTILAEKIVNLNQYQKNVLEKIKADICCCDTTVVNEAINLCGMRHQWMMNRMRRPETKDRKSTESLETMPCPWKSRCDWR